MTAAGRSAQERQKGCQLRHDGRTRHALHQKKSQATVEIKGLDIYDPIKDEVKSRDVHDIAYWMVDTDYDGANFIARHAFFCGGDKDEFAAWVCLLHVSERLVSS